MFSLRKNKITTRRLLHSALCGSLFCVEMVLYALGRSCVADPSCFYKKGLFLAERRIFNLIFIGVLVAMATSIVPMHIAGVIGAILVVVTGCISLEEAIKAFPTSTIFIVGGIFPLSKALVSSGAAEYLVNAISPVLSNLPPIVLLGAITFLMLLTTQFLMNSSATVLVLPIAIMLCQAAGINPLAGAMSVSVCASGAFVTPFGTAPNLLVWEAGGYSVKDYLKCGFPMLIIFGVVTTALCAVFYL